MTQPNSTTPLHEAARTGHANIVRALVSAGTDIHALDENGHPPSRRRQNGTCRNSATPHRRRIERQPQNRTGQHPTPPSHCRGDADRLRELIALGADLNVQDEDGNTPLHSEIASSRIELSKVFISAGADVNALDNCGATPSDHGERAAEWATEDTL